MLTLASACGALLVNDAEPAWAATGRRICALPEVVAAVRDELHRRGIDGDLDSRNPGEISDDGPLTACSISLRRRVFDTNHNGTVPSFLDQLVSYEVRRQSHSLMVTVN